MDGAERGAVEGTGFLDGGTACFAGPLFGGGELVADGLVEGGGTWVVAARLPAVVTCPHPETTEAADATVSANAASVFRVKRHRAGTALRPGALQARHLIEGDLTTAVRGYLEGPESRWTDRHAAMLSEISSGGFVPRG